MVFAKSVLRESRRTAKNVLGKSTAKVAEAESTADEVVAEAASKAVEVVPKAASTAGEVLPEAASTDNKVVAKAASTAAKVVACAASTGDEVQHFQCSCSLSDVFREARSTRRTCLPRTLEFDWSIDKNSSVCFLGQLRLRFGSKKALRNVSPLQVIAQSNKPVTG